MLGRVERGADAPFAERTEEADRDPQQRPHALYLGLDEGEGVVTDERKREERRHAGRHDEDTAHAERNAVGGGRPRLLRRSGLRPGVREDGPRQARLVLPDRRQGLCSGGNGPEPAVARVAQEHAAVGRDELERRDQQRVPRRTETGRPADGGERIRHRDPGIGQLRMLAESEDLDVLPQLLQRERKVAADDEQVVDRSARRRRRRPRRGGC